MIQKEKIKETVATVCSSGQTLSSCIIAMDGKDDTLYHHTSSLANGAGDNSYRYAGANPNNYVCFGSDATTCPEDNLYRIIGVFGNQVKLIKATIAKSNLLGTTGTYVSDTTYRWSSLETCPSSLAYVSNNVVFLAGEKSDTGCNLWNYSDLNKKNLNTNYLDNIGTIWSNLIENSTWKVSGHSTNGVTPSEMYTREITNATKTYGPSDGTSKIGLMYLSDYGFAASPSAWTKTLYNYKDTDANGTSIRTINWMYMGYMEWTISPISSYSNYVFILSDNGTQYLRSADNGYDTRPVFYLKSSVLYAEGSGTKDSPITLVV